MGAWGEEPDTLRAVDITSSTITQWNVLDGQLERKVPIAEGRSGEFSSGRVQFAIVTAAEPQPEVLIHDAISGKRIQTVPKGPVDVACTAISPAGSKLAICGKTQQSLVVIDVLKNEVDIQWPDLKLLSLSWSPDGLRLAGVGIGQPNDGGDFLNAGWVYVFDIEKRKRVMKVQHGTNRVPATTVAWSPDGQRLVSGNINGLAEVWDVETNGRIANAKLHVARINAISWSPDGRRVASASDDGEISVWDPSNGEELLKLDYIQANLTHLKWSLDGHRLAAAAANGEIHLWDANGGFDYAESDNCYWEWFHEKLNYVVQRREKGKHEEALASFEQTINMSYLRDFAYAGRPNSMGSRPWLQHDVTTDVVTRGTMFHSVWPREGPGICRKGTR